MKRKDDGETVDNGRKVLTAIFVFCLRTAGEEEKRGKQLISFLNRN